ncbi:hypothetical protein AAFC00_002581 [Neodothiora populina]|uniref:Essential protein Yae1 N-terminal domain-containing protein n=1 Tax=Neodothiora populina TaxID=2781224 RepID=A0ABR3P7J6_9PEZI
MSAQAEVQQADPFDSLLSLEDQYYNEGYNLGVSDGSQAGRIEGRIFGLEKGFEKFAAMGALAGRCAVWESRTSAAPTSEPDEGNLAGSAHLAESQRLKALPSNTRLAKHLQTLYALTEADSLSTENNEDSVSDFDDRFKRAEGKVKVIEKIIGEGPLVLEQPVESSSTTGASTGGPRRQIRVKRDNVGGESSMEDFNIRGARS